MTKITKKVIPISKGSIKLKCGDCLHFKRNAKFEKPCSLLGMKHFADAPACYSPDVYALTKQNPELLFQLGMMLKQFTAQETRVLMAVLKQANAFEKHYSLKFGQPVFFRIGSEEYVSNYFMGYVVGVSEAGEGQVFVTSDLRKTQRTNPMIGSFLRENVLILSEFRKRQQRLIKADLVQDPKPLFKAKPDKHIRDDDYIPPTIDKAPKEWVEKSKLKAQLKAKKKIKQLDGALVFEV